MRELRPVALHSFGRDIFAGSEDDPVLEDPGQARGRGRSGTGSRAGIVGLPVGAEPGHDTEIEVNLVAKGTPAANFDFVVAPARLVPELITERGICPATESGVRALFQEKAPPANRA